ncbi:MAG: dehydrogenase [Vicinamibacterales bacterium]
MSAELRAAAFWIVGEQRGEIREETLSPPGHHEVLVRTLHTGISRGTESLVFNGRVPASEYERMRSPFQAGSFPAPVKYGYINVGEVEAGPSSLLGKRIFVLYPHQTRYVVPVRAAHPLPDGVPSERALLAANLETAINVVWDARIQVGDRVSVVGAGVLGCLVAWVAHGIRGCHVQLIDINRDRSHVANRLGVAFATPSAAHGDADVVIHASGSPEGVSDALRLGAFEARIVEASWHGTRPVSVPLGEAFHSRRLTLVSSQVGAVATGQRARWDTRRRMQLALDLLADDVLDVLLTGRSPFESLPETLTGILQDGHVLCHCIDYSA